MSTECDSVTMDLWRRIVGMRLETVLARRYPGYLSYSQVMAVFEGGFSIRVDLEGATIAPKFEVFVARARLAELPTDLVEWDRFEFGDFAVASVFILRRSEWIDKTSVNPIPSIGIGGVDQKFGTLDDELGGSEAVVVDSGVCLVSRSGAELSIDADTFPLVFQLRYVVAPSPVPQGTRIAVNKYQMRQ